MYHNRTCILLCGHLRDALSSVRQSVKVRKALLTLLLSAMYISPKHSRFNPVLFYWIFIPCDILSLVLQAAGGAISAGSATGSQTGVNIALAGLGFQVGTLTIFIVLFIDYMIRARHVLSQTYVPRQFKVFISFLSLAALLILARCTYRIYELNEGYERTSKALRDQNLFIGLESV